MFQGNNQRVGKLKRLLSSIYNSSPKKVIRYLGRKIGGTGERGIQKKADEISLELNEKFDFYRTSNLSGIEPEEFREAIQSRIGKEDSQIEGFSEGSAFPWQSLYQPVFLQSDPLTPQDFSIPVVALREVSTGSVSLLP